MTDDELSKIMKGKSVNSAGPSIPRKRIAKQPASASDATEDKAGEPAKAIVKSEGDKAKRTIPPDPDDFMKAVRPYKPFASMVTKFYGRMLTHFDADELDAEERELVQTGTSAMLYENFDMLSGTYMFVFAIACTAIPRGLQIMQKRKEQQQQLGKGPVKQLMDNQLRSVPTPAPVPNQG